MVKTGLLNFLKFIGENCVLIYRIGALLSRARIGVKNTINQMGVIGVNSTPVVLVTVAFSGMVLSLIGAHQVAKVGAREYYGWLVAWTMAREAAPVLTALVVAARAGSAIAAEIGSMKITEQIDALKALATDPVGYLVVPRFLACMLMLPVLTVFSDIMGTAGGCFIASYYGVNPGEYMVSIRMRLMVSDLLSGLVKSVFFGMIIAIVSCYQGLSTKGGATGVGRSTTNSVVHAMVLILVADFCLNWLIFQKVLGQWLI